MSEPDVITGRFERREPALDVDPRQARFVGVPVTPAERDIDPADASVVVGARRPAKQFEGRDVLPYRFLPRERTFRLHGSGDATVECSCDVTAPFEVVGEESIAPGAPCSAPRQCFRGSAMDCGPRRGR